MEGPPEIKARAEMPAGAKSRRRAKEELQATEATLLRRHAKRMLLPKTTVGCGKEMVEVMEKLAANKADLKEARGKAGRKCSAPEPTSWEALRPRPSGVPRG